MLAPSGSARGGSAVRSFPRAPPDFFRSDRATPVSSGAVWSAVLQRREYRSGRPEEAPLPPNAAAALRTTRRRPVFGGILSGDRIRCGRLRRKKTASPTLRIFFGPQNACRRTAPHYCRIPAGATGQSRKSPRKHPSRILPLLEWIPGPVPLQGAAELRKFGRKLPHGLNHMVLNRAL